MRVVDAFGAAPTRLDKCSHHLPHAEARGYSGFDSALFKNLDAKWHFPQENATLLDLQMSTRKSKPL